MRKPSYLIRLLLALIAGVVESEAEPTTPAPLVAATNQAVDSKRDPMETWFEQTISEIKAKLKSGSLDAAGQEFWKSELDRYEKKLVQHTAKNQEIKAALDKQLAEIKKSSRSATPPQTLDQIFADTKVEYEKALAEGRFESKLWADHAAAIGKKDSALIVSAERKLVDHLTKKIEKINGRKYPSNMTLTEVVEELLAVSNH